MKTVTSRLAGPLIAFVVFSIFAPACAGATPPPKPATTLPTPTVAARASNTPVPTAPTRTVATPAPATAVPAAPAPAKAEPRYGGALQWVTYGEPGKLDLQQAAFGPQWVQMQPMLNWLVAVSSDKGIQPDLAERWEITEGGKVIIFYLTKSAKWHDGKPVTADDVVFNLNRMAFSKEINASARPTLTALDKVEKIDDFSVRLVLKRPSVGLLISLGSRFAPMYPRHVSIADFVKKTPAAVIGSGPYKFKEHAPGVRWSVMRNPDYFKKDEAGRRLPYMDGIDIFNIVDPATQYSAFRTGRIDVTNPDLNTPLVGKEKQVLQDAPGSSIISAQSWMGYLVFNAARKPSAYQDERVRKAFRLALDRQAFNRLQTQGVGTPYRAFSAPGTPAAIPEDEIKTWPGYNPATKQQDIAEAKRLLAEAGVRPADLKDAIVSFDTTPDVPINMASLLNQILGTDLRPDIQELAKTRETLNTKNFSLFASVVPGSLPDPSSELAPFVQCKSAYNYGNWCDSAVD
ncbi:MAG: ABC transporter substrate-binding protein, partial [Chloroflexi bacterium]|nr:ABC transporter substrate-binding protein [Chloroflexota bacterium]